MGHYKVMLECFQQHKPMLPEIVISIANMSLITATPLQRWTMASQLRLEKGNSR
jgi:hypothetical protein